MSLAISQNNQLTENWWHVIADQKKKTGKVYTSDSGDLKCIKKLVPPCLLIKICIQPREFTCQTLL